MRGRFLVRIADGAAYVQLLAVAGISTVLVTRAYLGLTGYPQVGNGTLHLAHALWGGLLLLLGLLAALLFAGTAARVWTALLGGVGLGLFVDEVGKLVTRTNDYFYRPAASIIYLVFAALLVLASHLRGRTSPDPAARLAVAAQIAADGVASNGLSPRRRASALALVEGADNPRAEAVRTMLEQVPIRPARLEELAVRPRAWATGLAGKAWFSNGILFSYVLSRLVVVAVFASQSLLLATGHHLSPDTDASAVVASTFTRSLTAVLAMVAVARWRRDRQSAYAWLRSAVLVDLLITQIFNFTDSQFRGIAELPFYLLVLALLAWLQRPRS